MRDLSNKGNFILRMPAAIRVMVRVCVRMGMHNGCAADSVRMRKHSNTCVVTHKEGYAKQRHYFSCFDHNLIAQE